MLTDMVSVRHLDDFSYTVDILEWTTMKKNGISLECIDYNEIVANRLLNHLLPDSMKV